LSRSSTTIWSIALHLLIGISGVSVGIPLVGGFLRGGLDPFEPSQRDVALAGAIAFGVLGYGLATVVGAIGIWRGTRAGWWLTVIVDLVGLAVLAWTVAITAFSDELLLGGVALWLVAIGLLLAPGTRAAVRR
jgi:hypothetical protein